MKNYKIKPTSIKQKNTPAIQGCTQNGEKAGIKRTRLVTNLLLFRKKITNLQYKRLKDSFYQDTKIQINHMKLMDAMFSWQPFHPDQKQKV